MSRRNDDDFRPKVGPPRAKGRGEIPRPGKRGALPLRFTTRVLKAAAKSGGSGRTGLKKRASRPGAQSGRGQVASRLARQNLGPRTRRVIIKTRLVVMAHASPTSTQDYLRYIQRDGVSRDGEAGRLYSADLDTVDRETFQNRIRDDRHQFRFIVSPEDGQEIGDLRSYTRDLMARMERDLGTKLDWVAVDHWDTDDPHTHVLLRGKDEYGADLIIAREYIAHGMRARAREVATDWLGPRTELEIRASLTREVEQERWTSLDEAIRHDAQAGRVDLRRDAQGTALDFHKSLQVGRLQRLQKMGLARELDAGVWFVNPTLETTLREMGERGDIIRKMQRTFSLEQRQYAIFDPTRSMTLTGRVAGKGLADELHDRGYLILDGLDGRAHYVALPAHSKLSEFPVGAVVEFRNDSRPRATDRTIVEVAKHGVYRVSDHLTEARQRERDPEGFVQTHVRRLEALRRAQIVERLDEGIWRVPPDLPARGQAYDNRRDATRGMQLRTHPSLEQQVRAMGATWLDRQLLARSDSPASIGFGSRVREAMAEREVFLVEQGFAEQRGPRVVLMRNLLATLQSRELESAAKGIAAETGLAYRVAEDSERISGTYRRPIQLVSGPFAMLDDGIGFTLVPWRPVIEKHLGQSVSAVVRGQSVSWEFGRSRGLSL
jgi:type IV secretory pathway VirD2 relaxase